MTDDRIPDTSDSWGSRRYSRRELLSLHEEILRRWSLVNVQHREITLRLNAILTADPYSLETSDLYEQENRVEASALPLHRALLDVRAALVPETFEGYLSIRSTRSGHRWGVLHRDEIAVRPIGVDADSEWPSDQTGLPRPSARTARWNDSGALNVSGPYPVPWSNGVFGLLGDFLTLRGDIAEAVAQRLCMMCGDRMDGAVAVVATNRHQETMGGWSHPICAALAVRRCPHLTKMLTKRPEVPVAYLHRGPGVGIQTVASVGAYEQRIVATAAPMTMPELSEMARTDPWGMS